MCLDRWITYTKGPHGLEESRGEIQGHMNHELYVLHQGFLLRCLPDLSMLSNASLDTTS